MLKVETLISHYILLEKLHLVVISLDSKLTCGFYEYLSEKWSVASQKEEQRLHTSPRDTNFVKLK